VDPNDTTREELRQVLLGLESIWLEAECSRYEFFYDVIAQSTPDVVIVSMDSDQSKALALISTLHGEAPDLPILVISARGDGNAILQALRSGAREFLTAPVVLEELLKALKRISPRQSSDSSSGSHAGNGRGATQSLVVSVLGSRGGVGCTTLAVNLGACLAREPNANVALVDLDMALGDADVALDMASDYTLVDVAMNIDKIDMQFLRRSLVKHACGLHVLPHPMQLEDAGVIQPEHLQRLVGLLRASYSHLVLDLSKSFSGCDVTALRLSDVILLVGQIELSSLRNLVRMNASLHHEAELAEKTQIVLNRVGGENDISLEKAEEILGKQIYWQIPNDYKVVSEARTQGAPLVSYAPKSKVHQSILGLAMALIGKKVKPVKEKRSGWAALFGR
jgi:pilus assembly protein CpaE